MRTRSRGACVKCGKALPPANGKYCSQDCRFDGATLEARFWARVAYRPGDCWLWRGRRSVDKRGPEYGDFLFHRKFYRAHRLSYELATGKALPRTQEIDHLCRTGLCVNPLHLEPVTKTENMLRGISPAAQHAVATHCLRGHAFDGKNTIFRRKSGHPGRFFRLCRKCCHIRYVRNRQRRTAAAAA